ncbi:MAG: hypothetical protein ACHQDY_08765 [Solirubrobacterales bacterium]
MSRSKFTVALRTIALMALPLALPGTGSGSGAGGSSGNGTGAAPSVSAIVEHCVTAATQAGRAVTFTGQMETVPGAHRMAMEIVVQEHAPGEVGFHTLAAAGSGTWQRSEVGVKIYKYVRQVTNLPAPAGFRATVQYRWLDDRGHVIRTTLRRTSVCRQPGERPRTETPSAATMPGA